MRPNFYQRFDPLFSAASADAMLRLCERFGRYGTYAEEGIDDDFGEGLAQRHDALLNFLRTGGRHGRREPAERLASRTNYFREEYAYAEPLVDGIGPFLHYEGFADAARNAFGRSIVEPAIVYANLLLPGQELAVHTDVPEFRGMSRRSDPQWLLVAMHHSGLFDRWRIPIATGVAWFGHPRGGDFVFYPDGPFGRPVAFPVRHNTGILLDTDTVFHGVDRVAEPESELPEILPGTALVFEGDGSWRLERDGEKLASYGWEDLRFSVSWKAHCYASEQERRLVREHGDDLTRAAVLDTLRGQLLERGIVRQDVSDTDLALAIIETWIQYPPPAPGREEG